MVMDGKKQERGRGFGPRYSDQPDSGPRPDLTRPLGPGMAYGRWGEELERQRIMAASRCLCPIALFALCQIVSPFTAFPPVVRHITVASPMLYAHAFAQGFGVSVSLFLCSTSSSLDAGGLFPQAALLMIRLSVPQAGKAQAQAQARPKRLVLSKPMAMAVAVSIIKMVHSTSMVSSIRQGRKRMVPSRWRAPQALYLLTEAFLGTTPMVHTQAPRMTPAHRTSTSISTTTMRFIRTGGTLT